MRLKRNIDHYNKYGRKHYETHKEQYLIRSKKRKDVALKFFIAYKKNKFCVDCSNSDFRVLDFDHLPKFKKHKEIIKMVYCGTSIKRILEEIKKCEIVCSNCHRIRTYNRRNNLP